MLDVHPAHHAATTWRDFFIHIITIVLGLLIAIGLEQTVERIHQHYELRDTREALEQERHTNDKDWARNESDWRGVFVELKNMLSQFEDFGHTASPRIKSVLEELSGQISSHLFPNEKLPVDRV
jgi:hypothetical protein